MATLEDHNLLNQKKQLIERWKAEGIVHDTAILRAFAAVRREDFVLNGQRPVAYMDDALPLLHGATISQPTTVAIMTQLLRPKRGQRILEVGSGSGYQAAILATIVGRLGRVVTIETDADVAAYAAANLRRFSNVHVAVGDGRKGHRAGAPYDCILVTAACNEIPKALQQQLKESGVIVAPVGSGEGQTMVMCIKRHGKLACTSHGAFLFVRLR